MSATNADTGVWYRQFGADTRAFVQTKLISLGNPEPSPFFCVCPIPWDTGSFTSDGLYDASDERIAELREKWTSVITPWVGSVIVGSTGCAYIFRNSLPPLRIRIPSATQATTSDEQNVKSVAWALDPRSWTDPLVILGAGRMIHIFDPSIPKKIGTLRGHGAEITSIAVHRVHPYMFLTTSRDQTTRLYDLRYRPRRTANNPHWPPAKGANYGGAAFGLHMNDSEGDGYGRCLAVLVGGRAGGHEAAVLQAAWHPTAELIATCGADNAVKIWRMPDINYQAVAADREQLVREDKPLFSTDVIHKARVLSIWWLSDDVLVSHSAPAPMRGQSLDEMYEEPGTVSVWRWLGFDRFLPEGRLRPNMTGCLSDFRNSESFRLLSVYAVPIGTPSIHVSAPASRSRDPLMFVPNGFTIRIFNIARFLPRNPPPFTPGVKADDHHNDDQSAEIMDEESDTEGNKVKPEVYERERPEKALHRELRGWVAEGKSLGCDTPPDIEQCALAFGGRVLLGVSTRGALCSWKLATRPSDYDD